MTKNDGVYLTLERNELVVHIPFRVALEELKPLTDKGSLNLSEFTKRERSVLDGILRGKQNKEIGQDLGISERTVKYYVGILLRKASATTRYELLARYGYRIGEDKCSAQISD